MGDRHLSFALLSGSRMSLESRVEGQTATLVSGGQWVGFIALATEFK